MEEEPLEEPMHSQHVRAASLGTTLQLAPALRPALLTELLPWTPSCSSLLP